MNNQTMPTRLEQARAALDSVRHTLDTTLDQLKAWQQTPDRQPSAAQLQQHRDLLLMAYARYRVLQGEYEALLNLNARLLKQHQSIKDAYQQGWDSARIELESRATEEQYTLLRHLFEEIDSDDS